MQSPQQGNVDVPQASNSGFVCDLLARTLGLWIGWVSSQGFVSAEAVVTVVENALENLKVVRKLLPFHAEVVLEQQLGALVEPFPMIHQEVKTKTEIADALEKG